MPTVSRGVYRWLLQRGATLEDLADRLNHVWTFGLLIFLACIIGWKQGVGNPMICVSPSHATASFVEYTNSRCWGSHIITYPRDVEKAYEELGFNESSYLSEVRSMNGMPYVTSSNNNIGNDLISKMSKTVTLYQWLPVLLCFQALLFKLPNTLMYVLHSLSGVSFDKISSLTSGYQNLNMNEREILGKQSGRYIYNWCKQFENCLPWRFLTMLWLCVKIIYCVNIIAQMCLIDGFLKTTDPPNDNSTSYGDVINDDIFENNATLWKESPVFPREVLCHFQINILMSLHSFNVQCRLPINEFNERVYMFLWVWLLIVAFVSCLSLVAWIHLTFIPIFRKRYVTKAMSLSPDINVEAIPSQDLNTFADLIGEDGVMTLKLIGDNSSEHVVRDVINTMWQMWIGDKPRYGHAGYGQPGPSTHAPEVSVP